MSRFVARWEVDDVTGAVVVVDVIRAFSTAAYAFAAGAREIHLVAASDEAAVTLELGAGHVHPDDIAYATRVDAFGFAMEVDRTAGTPVVRPR